MCLFGGGSSYPDLGPKDTSQDIIKSKYELSDENKRRNLERKRSSSSLVNFNGQGDNPNSDMRDGQDIGDLRENDFINDFFTGLGFDSYEPPADNKGGNRSSTGEGHGKSQGR